MRAPIFTCIAAVLISTGSIANDAGNYKLNSDDRKLIVNDYKSCKKNAGSSEIIMDNLTKRMVKMYESKLNKVKTLGSENYHDLILWASCLTQYTTDGADEELGYFLKFCDSYRDSRTLTDRIAYMAKYDKSISDFREVLLAYSRNFGVRCG